MSAKLTGHAVYDQVRRWLRAGSFEMLAHDLRAVPRLAAGRSEEPSAAVPDSRTLRSTPESGARTGWDGHKRSRGSKLHLAVDTLGHLLALQVTLASEGDRAAVAALAEAVQDATGQGVELAGACPPAGQRPDQGYTGERPGEAAGARGIKLEVVSLPEAKRGPACPPAGAARSGGAPAAPLGGRAQLRLDGALPKAGQGLRAPARDPRRPPSGRFCHSPTSTRRRLGLDP